MNRNSITIRDAFGIVAGSLLFIVLFGRGLWPHYGHKHRETVRDGIQSVPHVQQIVRVFANAPTDHFITHFGFDRSKPVKWNTEVFFGGRYILTYHVRILVDYEANRVKGIADSPQFYLKEVTSFTDGYESYGEQHRFGSAEWQKIVEANGDFLAAGIQLRSNAPVAGFDELIRSARAPRDGSR